MHIVGPCSEGQRVEESEASPFHVKFEKGTGVNLAKVSGDEHVQEKRGVGVCVVWCGVASQGQVATLPERDSPQLQLLPPWWEYEPINVFMNFYGFTIDNSFQKIF